MMHTFKLQVIFLAAATVASDCPAGQGLNETNGVNINIHYGNSSTDDPNGQNNNIFNVNPQPHNRGESCDNMVGEDAF